MKIVTVVHVHLNRIGSTRGGFGSHKRLTTYAEASDAEIETLRDLVISIAEQNGEAPGSLNDLRHERQSGHPPQVKVFNIHAPSTSFSEPYAYCEAFPALKADNRLFKLEELPS